MPNYGFDEFEVSKFLGGVVGAQYPELKDMACMSEDYREIYGYMLALEKLGGLKDLSKDEKKEWKALKKTIQIIGNSQFKQDVISHLSMKANIVEAEVDATQK